VSLTARADGPLLLAVTLVLVRGEIVEQLAHTGKHLDATLAVDGGHFFRGVEDSRLESDDFLLEHFWVGDLAPLLEHVDGPHSVGSYMDQHDVTAPPGQNRLHRRISSRSRGYFSENRVQALTTAGLELMSVPSMSKRTDSTAISTMCGSATGVRVPEAGTAKDDRRETAAEGGADGFGVGIADMVKACLVKTDMAKWGD
jgi:hypothetical protein